MADVSHKSRNHITIVLIRVRCALLFLSEWHFLFFLNEMDGCPELHGRPDRQMGGCSKQKKGQMDCLELVRWKGWVDGWIK